MYTLMEKKKWTQEEKEFEERMDAIFKSAREASEEEDDLSGGTG